MPINDEFIATIEFSYQVDMETTSALIIEEGTLTSKEEAVETIEFSGQVEMETASALMVEEGTTTIKE